MQQVAFKGKTFIHLYLLPKQHHLLGGKRYLCLRESVHSIHRKLHKLGKIF